MKKNIIIIILFAIIIFLSAKILNPTVVTSRKISEAQNQNISSYLENSAGYNNQNNTNDNITYEQNIPQAPMKREMSNDIQPVDHREFEHFDSRQKPDSNRDYQRQNVDYNRNHNNIPPAKRNIQNEYYNQNIPNRYEENLKYNPQAENKNNIRPNKFENFISICKPYSEKLTTEYMGVQMQYQIDINGWINDKCVLNFTAKIDSLGSTFGQIFGGEASEVYGFAPKIRCEFTKEQLLYVGDAILQENERNTGATNNMLKNPDDIKWNKAQSNSDEKLLQVIFNDQACKILNTNEITKIFEGIK